MVNLWGAGGWAGRYVRGRAWGSRVFWLVDCEWLGGWWLGASGWKVSSFGRVVGGFDEI